MKAIFLDLETNGLDYAAHNVLEVGVVLYNLHDMTCIHEYNSFVKCSERQFLFGSDPESLAFNGITFSDVSSGKDCSEICEDLTELFLTYEIDRTNAIFICQNPSFDRPFFDQIMSVEVQKELDLPYHWLDLASMYWAKSVDLSKPVNGHNLEPPISLSKDNIAYALRIPKEAKPHRALQGVKHLIKCYKAIMSLSNSFI